jgi:hypothetical protein
MNGADAVQRVLTLCVGAKRQRQHRPDRRVQACGRGERSRAEAAVIVDARRNQRVGQLEQNRARPAEQDEPFGVETLRDYCGSFPGLAPPVLPADASAAADFHSHPATPMSARLMAPCRASFQPLPFGRCAGSSSVRYA